MKYISRLPVEAVQFNGRKNGAVHWGFAPDWIKTVTQRRPELDDTIEVIEDFAVRVKSKSQIMIALIGDWIVRHESGRMVVFKAKEFEREFSPVLD